MTKPVTLFFLLFLFGCSQNNSISEVSSSKKGFMIVYAGLTSSAPLSITCDLFDWGAFSKKDTIVITDKSDEYLVLKNLFKKFTIDSSISSIDTRIKINYVEDTICMDKFGHFYSKNKDTYMRNDSLSTFIHKKIN